MRKRTRMQQVSVLLIVSLLFSMVGTIGNLAFPRTARAATTTGQLLQSVYTDKARYNPGDTATITVAEQNNTGSSWSGTLTLVITHLEQQVYTTTANVALGTGATGTTTFTWTTPTTDYQGYRVEVTAGTIDYLASAIDVSSNWTHFPRYGEMDAFPTTETQSQSQSMINQLAQNYHINAYQQYDWEWRHENLIQKTGGVPNSTYTDWSGRTINWNTLQNQINAIHAQNGAAMAYVMSYAGLNGYQQTSGVDPAWGMYTDTSHTTQWNFSFGGTYTTSMYMFNPSSTGWQNWMVGQYQDALTTGHFDGLQVDQLGTPWVSNLYDYNGQAIDLGNAFSTLLNNDKATNTAHKMTFNVVNGGVDTWAMNNVVRYANTDFTYSELWDNSPSYTTVKAFVDAARQRTNNKPVVLAGYMNYYDDNGPLYEAHLAQLNGVTTNTNHTGSTDGTFVDGFTTAGSSVTFTINAPEAGKYALVFRYANATGGASYRNIYVDGTLNATVQFNNQTNWDTWAYDAYTLATLSAGTHTVKVSYDSGNSGAINLDTLVLGTFDEPSVRLADAAFAASGASHIEMGEGDQMLAHPYFVNHYKQMRNSLKSAMKDQYDFITAYENLLFDSDVNSTDSGSQFVNINGVATNGDGSGNAVWTVLKHSTNYDMVHLINLLNHDNQWRHTTNGTAPTTQNNLAVKYYIGPNVSVSGVYLASPDSNHGLTSSLSYTTGSDANGKYISFTVPSLQYWDMIYVKRTFTAPASNQYEAESAILKGVTTNTNHLGYTGTGFVDGFTGSGSGVSFVVNAPANDSYTLRFRYANATTGNSTRNVYVDGMKAGTVTFRNLFNWDMWDTSDLVVRLTPGLHNVVLWYDTSNTGAINLDNMQVLEQTVPASRSNTSLWMNNWSNLVGIVMASKLSPADTGNYGPRLGELHYSGDWATNQLVDATGFFRDETGGTVTKYDNAHSFDSAQWFESDGTMTQKYLNYGGAGVPVQVTKQYAMVPNQNILAVKYTFTNLTNSARTFNFLEQAHLANKTTNSYQHGWYDSSRNSLGTDMSQSGQYYIELGALQAMDSHQVGNDSDSTLTDVNSAPWYQFDANGTLKNNNDIWVQNQNLDLGWQKSISLAANGTATIGLYYTIGSTQAAAEAAADTARAQTVDYWFNQTATSYTNWLNAGKRVSLADTGLNTAFDRSLIINKQAQQPQYGSWPAATNPAYSYKVWVRDSAATAMGMDATGHTAEAEKYWNWMASVQNTDGTWHTNYSVWAANQWISFVEPEDDSMGLFLIGVYRHYKSLDAVNHTTAMTFLNGVWPQVKLAGDWIKNNIGANGFGPADASIWEESPNEYNTYTQTTYTEGLNAASYLATAESDTTRQSNYSSGATTIKNAMLRNSSASPNRGLWNDANRYFDRGVNTDGSADTKVDSSSDLTWIFGLLPVTDTRVQDHRIHILSVLQNDGYGIPRYPNDPFYYSSQYSPGGMYEAGGASPVWPQMSMYAAMEEHWAGNDASALARLQWYASRTATGFVTPGEAVDWTNGQPLISTSAEPVTGSWFEMAVLNYLNQYDSRLPGY